jgi:hypothetical protein
MFAGWARRASSAKRRSTWRPGPNLDALITSGKLVPAAPRSILSLSYAELRELADRHLAAGWCLRWLTLTETAGPWAPAASLGDVFKVLDPARLEAIAAAVRLGGFEVLEDGPAG